MTMLQHARRALICSTAFALLACRGNGAEVTVRFGGATLLPRESLSVTVDDGASRRTLQGTGIGGGGYEGRVLATEQAGTLRVGYRFDVGQVVASAGDVAVPLRADWRYDFEIQVDSTNPTLLCIGCAGARAFPIAAAYRRSAKDSVWVVWGGNSISHPVIY